MTEREAVRALAKAQKAKVAELSGKIGGQTSGWMADFRYEVGVLAGLTKALEAINAAREAELDANYAAAFGGGAGG